MWSARSCIARALDRQQRDHWASEVDGDETVSDESVDREIEYIRAPITDQDLLDYSAEKFTNAKCEMCQTDTWIAIKAFKDDHVPVLPSVIRGEGTEKGTSTFPCVLFVCDNCGNTKMIARRVLGEWKLNRPGSTDK